MLDDFVKDFYRRIGKNNILLGYDVFDRDILQVFPYGLVAVFASPVSKKNYREIWLVSGNSCCKQRFYSQATTAVFYPGTQYFFRIMVDQKMEIMPDPVSRFKKGSIGTLKFVGLSAY